MTTHDRRFIVFKCKHAKSAAWRCSSEVLLPFNVWEQRDQHAFTEVCVRMFVGHMMISISTIDHVHKHDVDVGMKYTIALVINYFQLQVPVTIVHGLHTTNHCYCPTKFNPMDLMDDINGKLYRDDPTWYKSCAVLRMEIKANEHFVKETRELYPHD